MKPFLLDKDVIINQYGLSPFSMVPGKVYYIKFPHYDILTFLCEHSKATHQSYMLTVGDVAGNWFEKRRRVSKVLRKRGDADYFINFFSFLPNITPRLVSMYDYTAKKLFNFEYHYRQHDLFILDMAMHDGEGKQNIFNYLRNRDILEKIIIVFDYENKPLTNKYAFAEWNENDFDVLMPKRIPRYPNSLSADDITPWIP
ncbi:hypothetical protein GO495_13230 [Chitinophaga oryziterrae]|uniref:Uncharacterized protein n=1 Tax=Chitinophaga oryziterrae TaxID=1031224 RepID=A0A6N8J8I1_9BACT|nr:hypothetical protein [Chitinophaga oryziterrae]MVT41550.1 hypothetical protein [Chitinophaga oryziterrae]